MAGLWIIIGGLNGLVGVIAGAYGWHELGADDPLREIFMMGVTYQMWHALAVLLIALAAGREELAGSRLADMAGLSFCLGIFLFSGSLYSYAVLGHLPVTGAAPAGGMLLMIGWGLVMVIGWKTLKSNKALPS